MSHKITNNYRILVVIPCLNYPKETIDSINSQTVKCKNIILADKRFDMKMPKSLRVSKAINYALRDIDLNDYDFLIKIDSDTTLDNSFIENNIKYNYGLIGGGRCLIINVPLFIEISGGRFVECYADDTALFAQFKRSYNYDVLPWKWIYPTDNNLHKSNNTLKELFLIGYDTGRMRVMINKKFIVTKPIEFLGWVIGLFSPELAI